MSTTDCNRWEDWVTDKGGVLRFRDMVVVTEDGGVLIVMEDIFVIGVTMEDEVVTDSGDIAGSPFVSLRYDSKERLVRFRRVAENFRRSLLGRDVDVDEASCCFSFGGSLTTSVNIARQGDTILFPIQFFE
jgi:hypothetical protein